MHHLEQKCVHFCSEWCIVGYGRGAICDLWNWSRTLVIIQFNGQGLNYVNMDVFLCGFFLNVFLIMNCIYQTSILLEILDYYLYPAGLRRRKFNGELTCNTHIKWTYIIQVKDERKMGHLAQPAFSNTLTCEKKSYFHWSSLKVYSLGLSWQNWWHVTK